MSKTHLVSVSVALVAGLGLFGCSSKPEGPPYTPEQALETFELDERFQIELFAAEPDLADPVAMDIDEYGRIWVVEDSGYPLDVEGHRGRIKLLHDTNQDGRPDKMTLFADKLVMPTGIMAWRDGVLVTDAPDVLYMADTDGDGKADVRETVLTGFAFTNPQHTVSSPVYGLDNWIYLSHEGYTRAVIFSEEFGDTGTEIHFPDQPDGPHVPVVRRSVRFRPDSHELELLAGPSQFGTAFDAWGEVFTHNNSNHSRHEVIAARYLERNPSLRISQTWQDMFEEPNPATVFPITVNPRFEILSSVGQMTSACGLTRYLGGAFPGFEDVAFVAEPTHNVVHADRWETDASTFIARRLRPDREFLASTDAWFRPVNFYIGPDGALYMIDYYREVIEHPEWTSAEIYESEIIYQGDDKGRIYRITPKGGLPFVGANLAKASVEELAAALASENIWYRRTAQRLLVSRGDPSVARVVEKVANGDSAVGRVHALWTLEGLGSLSAETIEHALNDDEAGVRKNAIRLAEPRLAAEPRLQALLVGMRDDPDAQVRLQLLLTLGDVKSAEARAIRDDYLVEGIEDPWVQAAAMSWPDDRPAALFTRVSPRIGAEESEGRRRFVEQVGASVAASGDAAQVSAWVRQASRDSVEWRREASLQGLADGLEGPERRRLFSDGDRTALLALAFSANADTRHAALGVLAESGVGSSAAVLSRAAGVAGDLSADSGLRADAVRLLALADPSQYADLLRGLVVPAQPEEVQAAAVAAYGEVDSDEVVAFMLEKWRGLPGRVRAEAADAMIRNNERVQALVEAMERGDIQAWMLPARPRQRLIMNDDPELRARARKLLTVPAEDRQAVVDRYKLALTMEGEAPLGRGVFTRVCKECHAFKGEGQEVGPDLATVSTRPAAAILSDILLPNESIAQTYESYIVETKDGRMLDGVIGPQGPTFITLRREGGQEDVIPRSEILEMRATQMSAMPNDLENQISVEDMANLIRYIKSAR